MVDVVTSEDTSFEDPPLRFEAGTPNYVGAIALAAALDYLCGIGRDNICCREHELLAYAEERIARVPGLSVVGRPGRRAGCLSFAVQDVHPFLPPGYPHGHPGRGAAFGQPVRPAASARSARRAEALTRLSPAFYNTFEEIDACVAALERVVPLLQGTARSGR